MSLDNVHPEVLKRVQGQLPEGSIITSASSESETGSVFMVTYRGRERRTLMPKASTCNFLANRVVEIEAKQGDKLNDLISVISDTYRLYLVPGVDYTVPKETVDFGCQGIIQHSFPILEKSVSLYGTVSFNIKNKDVCNRPKERLPTDLTLQQIQLALVSKVFVPIGKVFEGNKLTVGFSQQLVQHLHSLDLAPNLTPKKFGVGPVLDDYQDGVSRLVVVKTFDDNVVAIRYEADEEDKPVLDKPEVVESEEEQ